MARIAIALSGGMDSAVLLAHYKNQEHEVHALSVYYGQRHKKELQSAACIAKHYDVPHISMRLDDLSEMLRTSTSCALVNSGEIPEGHYAAESMKATVVPNRNMILLSLLASFAIVRECTGLAYAAHAGDHAIYPDCRLEFAAAMEEALRLCDWQPLQLLTPFVNMSKADLVALGTKLNVPFALTWSCYNGLSYPCGRCGTCVERLEAFAAVGERDPLPYDDYDREYWRTALKEHKQ